MLVRRLALVTPAVTGAFSQRHEPPVHDAKRRRRGAVIRRRSSAPRAPREEAPQRFAQAQPGGAFTLELAALGEGQPALAHHPLEENERDDQDGQDDEELEAAHDERPVPLDLTKHRLLLLGRALRNAPLDPRQIDPAKERLEQHHHRRREIAERQEDEEDDTVPGHAERRPERAEQLLDERRQKRDDQTRDAQAE